ncbi:carboxypeptidase-like regulatory domain-containing protein [Olivibacter sitiensis]|uniref:carboxypeptidase-like regulatory domain-containing protein n=1 Tax=Olivibacter sitiensis TaxID=376470 RepID=UPI0003FB3831|nr:carboxypeptidase-like regulatory domain-containing protein [Olivibacter sitiensis]
MFNIFKIGLTAFLSLVISLVSAQTLVKGVIRDAQSGETLPFATVQVPGTKIGTSADIDGRYSLRIDGDAKAVQFAYIGYITQEQSIQPGVEQTINVKLEVNANMLSEVVITGQKSRYRNRDNPAVQLIRQVIAHKDSNRMGSHPFEEFKQYEKVSLSLSNISDKFRNRKIFKNYQFLFKEQDSTEIGGKTILPAYMTEKLTQVYSRRDPDKKKEIVLAEKNAQFDRQFIDSEGMKDYVNRLYENIDIYDNNILLATNQFLSPIAGTAPTFYKFYHY